MRGKPGENERAGEDAGRGAEKFGGEDARAGHVDGAGAADAGAGRVGDPQGTGGTGMRRHLEEEWRVWDLFDVMGGE